MEAQIKEVLGVLISLVILPSIPILAKYAVSALKEWANSKSIEFDNEVMAGYISYITDIISQAVISTTQTYVDTLKTQGKFDEEAQKIAFEKTKTTVMALLAEDAKDFIARVYGDVDLWLDTKIEQMVNENKTCQPILIAEA